MWSDVRPCLVHFKVTMNSKVEFKPAAKFQDELVKKTWSPSKSVQYSVVTKTSDLFWIGP